MSPSGSIFVVGSGPQIGAHIARLFATKSFTNVALFARSPSSLAQNASFITSAAPSTSVHTYSVNVTNDARLKAALEKAVSEAGPPEVVIYNAARIQTGRIGEYAPEDIVQDFKVPNLGLCTTAVVLIPHLQALAKSNSSAHPSLFVRRVPSSMSHSLNISLWPWPRSHRLL